MPNPGGGGGGGPNPPPASGGAPNPGGGPNPGCGGGGAPNPGGPGGPMGEAQMAQNLSAGVAGAPQRGQIMFTLLVKLGGRPTGYDAERADVRRAGAYRGRSPVDQEDVRRDADLPETAP
jgi:hypothetical protein